MINSVNDLFLRIGFFFGGWILKILERLFPRFRDNNQDLYGFTDYYLVKYNLTNRENLKRNFKIGIIFSTSFAFWTYAIMLIYNLFRISSLQLHLNLLRVFLTVFVALILISVYVAYKLSRE